TGKLVSTIAFKKDVSEFKMAAVGEYWLGKDGDQLYIWKLYTANWKHSGEKYSTMTYEYPTRTIVLDTEIKAIAFTKKGDVVKIASSRAEQAFLHQIPLNAPRCPPRTRLDLSAHKDVAFRYNENYRYAMAVGSSLHTTTLDNKPLSHSSFEQKGRLDIAKFAPDATLLATTHQARDSNIISIWKLHPLQKKYQLKNSYVEVRDLAISPNNRYLAAITRDPLQLEVWQLEEQKLLHIFELPDTYIESLIFSPDGKMLATNSGLVYDLEKGERLFEIAFEDSNRTTNLTFSSDGKLLASHFRNSEGILKVWNGKTGKEIRSFPLAQDTRLLHPQSTPDGKEIILMGNKDISFLDLSSGKIVRKYDHYYGWISGAGNAKVKVSKDQEYLVFGESRGLRCIRLSTAALLEEYKDRLAALTKEQLEDYGLMETLEQLPNVWDAILEQEDAMQLHYFGDFFLEKVGKNYNPLVFDPLFEQAERFYLKAAERSNTDINRASLSKLYVRWARHFYKAEDYEQAKSKALLANEWQIDFNSLGILNTSCKILNEVLNWEAYANGSSKREVADLLSKDYQSEEALQLYRDLDYQDLPIRRRLEIYEKDLQLGKDRFQELIATNDVEELESLQSQLRIKNWRNLEKRALIAEKIFALDSTLENRLKLHFIAFATGKNYSESLFDNLDNSTDRAIVLNAMITNYLFESEEIRTYLNQLVKQIVLEDIDTERYDEFKGLDPFDKLYFVAQLYTLALTNEENALEVVSSHLDTTELADFYFDYFMQKTSTYFSKKVREAFYKKHLENYLELALQLDLPKHPRAKTDQYLNQLNNLGWRLLEKGEFAMGEAYIRLGIRINPDFDCFYTNLAPSLLLQGKYEAAKIEYEKWVDQTCTCGRSKRLYQSFFSQDLSSLKRLGTIPEEHLSKVEEIKVWLRNK
ncbi:MAG: WD40 repeat domain-containing protein, partial [Bacteroidota bacterium]